MPWLLLNAHSGNLLERKSPSWHGSACGSSDERGVYGHWGESSGTSGQGTSSICGLPRAGASVTGRVRTRNSYGYKYGSALLWSLRGDYRLLDWLSAGVSLDGRYAARDDLNGTLQENTGGLVVAAVPGVKVRLFQELWLWGSVQIPVLTHLFGDQHVGPVFTASVQYTFQ